jgi:hypothetical protein
LRGEVAYPLGLRPGYRLGDRRRIGDVDFRVEADRFVTVLLEMADQPLADKTLAAGDQYAHDRRR